MARWVIIPLTAICFSVPVGMLLYLAWPAVTRRPYEELVDFDLMLLAVATILISVPLASYAQQSGRSGRVRL